MPSGRETIMAMLVVIRVAETKGQTPNLPMRGCHSVARKNRADSCMRTKTRPMVVRMDTSPARKREPWIIVSPIRGRRRRLSAREGSVDMGWALTCDLETSAVIEGSPGATSSGQTNRIRHKLLFWGK